MTVGRHEQEIPSAGWIPGGWVPTERVSGRAGSARRVPTDSNGFSDTDQNGDEPENADESDELGSANVDSEGHQPDGPRANGFARRAGHVGRTWGRFAELWVPESLREARVDPGRRGALILLLVVALAAVVTAVGVWRDRPDVRAVDTSVVAALGASSEGGVTDLGVASGSADGSDTDGAVDSNAAAPAGAPTGAAPGDMSGSSVPPAVTEIVASVTGLVAAPGVVTLAPGARVADAIAAAGGPAPGADLTGLNLAARLSDGDSVVVGSAPVAGGVASGVTGAPAGADPHNGGASAGAAGLLNLNSADEAALDTLPGVGPVMAQNILAWREANGRFSSVEQLQEISGIGPSRYAQIAPLVTVA
jgi:competence protein ComEA